MKNKLTIQNSSEAASCEGRYLIAVLRAFLNELEPPRPPEGFNAGRFIKLVEAQSVVGIVADELEKRPEFFSQRFTDVLESLRAKEFFCDACFQVTRAKVDALLEANKIRYLPLKGAIMKDLYPRSYQRSASDYDVLVDASEIQRARVLVKENLGYGNETRNRQHSCLTSNSTLTTVELHHVFYGRYDTPVFADIWRRALPPEDERSQKTFQYRFTLEDFYLCMVLHLARHWLCYEATIRMFVDVWLFNRKYCGKYDRASLDEPLRKDGSLDFVRNVERAGRVWFEGLEGDELVEAMAKRLFNPPKKAPCAGADPTAPRKNRLNRFVDAILCIREIEPYLSELKRLPGCKRVLRIVGLWLKTTWGRLKAGGVFRKIGACLFARDRTEERIAEESMFGLIGVSRGDP